MTLFLLLCFINVITVFNLRDRLYFLFLFIPDCVQIAFINLNKQICF